MTTQQTPTIRETWDKRVAELVAQGFPSTASASVALALAEPALAAAAEAERGGPSGVTATARLGTLPRLILTGE